MEAILIVIALVVVVVVIGFVSFVIGLFDKETGDTLKSVNKHLKSKLANKTKEL